MRDCSRLPSLPVDNPAEFSRATRYVEPCVSWDGLRAAGSEFDVGVTATALFLGAPSRSYPEGQR